ncbi:RDD family protein [Enterococcus faecalis]|nr:RDD family protein [Enterococcus faecalis]
MQASNTNTTKKEHKKEFNKFPNYFYAGFWLRFFAFVIDLLCINILISATIGLVYKLIGLEMNSSLITIYGFLSLVIYLTYFVLLTKLNAGQTIGKMIFGLRVISFEEDTLSWQTVLIRELICRFILKTFFFSVGYLVTIFTPKKQHIGDYFSSTSVIILNFLNAS